MRLFLSLIALILGLAPQVAHASHLDALRQAEEGVEVSDLALILGGSLTFLVVGAVIFLGLRYLRSREKACSPDILSQEQK